MPSLHADVESSEMELGIFHQSFEDKRFMQKLGVYATIRPDNLKNTVRTNGHESLSALLQNWRQGRVTENVEEREPKQLELRDYEMVVKGFDIDGRIAPGFRYHVRYLGTNRYLFEGEARCLESIGNGYGRRLTFKGERLNFNDCCFWSDSIPSGYAFSINAVREGDTYKILDADSSEIGSATIQSVDFAQTEKNTLVEGGNVVKNVAVRFSCLLKLHTHNHSLINVNTQDYEVVEGVAQLVKEKGSKEAVVKCIKDVHFKSVGRCTLHCDP